MMKNMLDNLAAQQILTALDGQAYFVGGAVRDFLLAAPATDIDMATPLLPEEVTEKLKATGCTVVPTGLAFGTVTVIYKKHRVELTTFRQDVRCDGRHAEVLFGTSMKSDAARRDFTINALYMNRDGTLFDFFHGRRDLKKGRVRFIGSPEARIQEDTLRVLRFFRFWGRFGRGKPDPAALKACRAVRKKLTKLSLQRRHDEMIKILAGPRADVVLRYMARAGVLKPLIKGPWDFKALRRVIIRERRLGYTDTPHVVTRLCAFQPQGDPPMWLQHKERRAFMDLRKALAVPDRPRALFLYGKKAVQQKELMNRPRLTRRSFEDIKKWREPKFPITSGDVIRREKVEGKALSLAFKRYRETWLDLGCPREKEVVFRALSG